MKRATVMSSCYSRQLMSSFHHSILWPINGLEFSILIFTLPVKIYYAFYFYKYSDPKCNANIKLLTVTLSFQKLDFSLPCVADSVFYPSISVALRTIFSKKNSTTFHCVCKGGRAFNKAHVIFYEVGTKTRKAEQVKTLSVVILFISNLPCCLLLREQWNKCGITRQMVVSYYFRNMN